MKNETKACYKCNIKFKINGFYNNDDICNNCNNIKCNHCYSNINITKWCNQDYICRNCLVNNNKKSFCSNCYTIKELSEFPKHSSSKMV